MAESLIIYRVGHPAAEQGVRITQGIDKAFWINPKAEVERALGERNLRREGKIIAFAQGLVAAGHRVFILDRRHPYEKRLLYQFQAEPTCINVLYYLYGRAWGSGQWNSLILQLQTFIVQAEWYSVYSTTAHYSFNHPWEQEIRLQLPR